jgi:hypothetical protein
LELDVADNVQGTGPTEEKGLKIKDIEPLLKWGAVAYSAGFLTVMLHTHRLGLPVMQLIEPIYVWIGAPFAITLYFLEPLIAAYKRRRQLLRDEMDKINQDLTELAAIEAPKEAAEAAVKALAEMIVLLTRSIVDLVPAGASFLEVTREFVLPRLQKFLDKNLETGNAEQLRSILIRFTARLTFVTRSLTAFANFGSRLQPLALLVLALVLYTLWVYPAIPQSLGGGKPSQARLIIEVKRVPPDDFNLKGLFPRGEPERTAADSPKTTPEKPESQITCTVALLYETEHAYYIRRGRGPIVVIDHDAVNGIIFVPSESAARKGCTQ